MIGKLAIMCIIVGSPAIFGAWVGGFAYSPFSSVVFLSIGAGAIFQIIIIILKWIRGGGQKSIQCCNCIWIYPWHVNHVSYKYLDLIKLVQDEL